jgi:SagB-type dehydrogenase family enzyme
MRALPAIFSPAGPAREEALLSPSPNRETEAVRRYHQATSHSYWSVRSRGQELDWPNYPRPFKIYPQIESISLPREFPPTGTPALAPPLAPGGAMPTPARTEVSPADQQESVTLTAALGDDHREFRRPLVRKGPVPASPAAPLSPTLAQLAAILYYSAGVTRRRAWPGGEMYFRAAACTGALYEIELYVVTRGLDGLPAGVYHFSPADFGLRPLRAGDWRGVLVAATSSESAVVHAPVAIVATGIYWRNAWKYGARTYRHFGWDNGTIHANLLAMAAAHRLPARLVVGFEDEPVNRLLDLATEKEVALSIVALGAVEEPAPAAGAEIPPLGLETIPPSAEEIDYPAMREVHAATRLTTAAEVAAWRDAASRPLVAQPILAAQKETAVQLPTPPLAHVEPQETSLDSRSTSHDDSLETVIARRGSSRRFARQPITLQQLSTALEFSTRPLSADFLAPGERLNDLYVIANAVEGLDAGSYVFERDPLRLDLLEAGSFREQAQYLALEQALAGDAAAAVFFLADLDAILERFGNRGYRAAQLEAGILGGRLYLAAYAQRLGATGLTFYDDDVVQFFSPHAASKAAIFLVAIGHPAKRLRTL